MKVLLVYILVALTSVTVFAGNDFIFSFSTLSKNVITQREVPFYEVKDGKCDFDKNTKVITCVEAGRIPSGKQVVLTGNAIEINYKMGLFGSKGYKVYYEVITVGNDGMMRRIYINEQLGPEFP